MSKNYNFNRIPMGLKSIPENHSKADDFIERFMTQWSVFKMQENDPTERLIEAMAKEQQCFLCHALILLIEKAEEKVGQTDLTISFRSEVEARFERVRKKPWQFFKDN